EAAHVHLGSEAGDEAPDRVRAAYRLDPHPVEIDLESPRDADQNGPVARAFDRDDHRYSRLHAARASHEDRRDDRAVVGNARPPARARRRWDERSTPQSLARLARGPRPAGADDSRGRGRDRPPDRVDRGPAGTEAPPQDS